MDQLLFRKTVAVSVALHAALFGLLMLLGGRMPPLPANPLQVRILPAPEAPVPPAPRPAPAPPRGEPRGQERRMPEERVERPGRGLAPDVPPPPPAPGRQPAPPAPQAGAEVPRPPLEGAPPALRRPETPPQATNRPVPEAPPGVAEARRERSQEPPARSGLSLGGPPLERAPSSRPGNQSGGMAKPSILDQISRLGTGLKDSVGEEGKQTVNLDSREPRFQDYLTRLKWRVEREWQYPVDAMQNGVSGELLLIFTLNKNGVLTNIRLLESSGFPILDEEALRAVKAAAPFDAFPAHLGDEPWNIRASFRYYTNYRMRRG
jgi:periplasmic protein TonB